LLLSDLLEQLLLSLGRLTCSEIDSDPTQMLEIDQIASSQLLEIE
jgi:hypothetical protein